MQHINKQLTQTRDQEVAARSPLQNQDDELRWFNQVTEGRELRMIDLKCEPYSLHQTLDDDKHAPPGTPAPTKHQNPSEPDAQTPPGLPG